jgi:hypothetical protein
MVDAFRLLKADRTPLLDAVIRVVKMENCLAGGVPPGRIAG